MMLDLSPLLSTFGWPLEKPLNHDEVAYSNRDVETTPESLFDHQYLTLPPHDHQPQLGLLDAITSSYGTTTAEPNKVIKKLNHNASERDRRKKINCLYSFLRSLLPGEDQMKKLSIPGTISRALKYIPEVQQQVERLIKKREELWSVLSSSRQQDAVHNQESQVSKRSSNQLALSSSSRVSAARVSDTEIAVQITNSMMLHQDSSLSLILHSLEQDGLLLISANSFVSPGGIIFYNLHLQVERSYNLEIEVLSKKILSLQEKREYLFS